LASVASALAAEAEAATATPAAWLPGSDKLLELPESA
jgi:hypothetical protein